MGRELPSRKGVFNFPVGKELLSGKRVSRWEKSFPVGRELPSGNRAFRCEGSLLVGRELSYEKAASK